MENETDQGKRRHCLGATVDVMQFVFSLVSFAFCFLLSVQTSDMKDRIVDLEIGSGAGVLNPFHGIAMDQFNAMIQERVDELLSQRSYEHLVRIRTARQVSPPECNCPPGQGFGCQSMMPSAGKMAAQTLLMAMSKPVII
ncbi:hypothetical protein G5714_007770 [Onychostoma macrolepis]|uniref:Uncharacterized protein n=1 Tax=Onychostoma macrolepis TaxID=369639 RepID=A0A7J6CTR4_9TELE|nr:hypothetical protein G5714_007770 [Onychostoma macrolepis]